MNNFVSRNSATLTVLLCFCTALFEGIDLQAAGVAAPRIIPLFKISPQHAGLFFSASTLGLLAGATLGGRLADRVGRKAVLLASIILFGVFALSTAFAWNFDSLVALRLATGLGLGGALPNMIALVSEGSRPERRGFAVGLMYCGMPLGGALASAINLGGGADWRDVFYIGGIAPLLLAPLIAIALPDSLKLLVRGAQAAAKPGRIAQALFGGGRWAKTLLLWIGFGFSLLVLYLLLNWLPSLLVSRGFSKPDASLVQIMLNLGGAAGSAFAGRLIDGRRRGLVTALSFAATSVFLLAVAAMPASLGWAVVLGGALGLGIMSNQAILYAIAPWCYPTEVRGTGVGFAVAIGRTGSLIGPLVAGQLVGSGHDAGQVLTHMIPVILIGAAATVTLCLLLGRDAASRA